MNLSGWDYLREQQTLQVSRKAILRIVAFQWLNLHALNFHTLHLTIQANNS